MQYTLLPKYNIFVVSWWFLGDTFSVHKSTVCRVIHRVTAATASLQSKYLRLPQTVQERRDVMNMYYTRVIGEIDCTHELI